MYSEAELKQRVSSLWELDSSISRITEIAAGVENQNWFVYAKGDDSYPKWVLTAVKSITPKRFEWVRELTRHIGTSGVSCPVYLPQASSCQTQNYSLNGIKSESRNDPQCTWALAVFNKGNSVTESECTNDLLYAVGAGLATLHKALEDGPKPPKESGADALQPGGVENLANILSSQVNFSTAERECMGVGLNAYATLLETRNREDLTWSTIHGDLFMDNLLFNGKELTFLDFFGARYDSQIFDFAMMSYAWSWSEETASFNPDYHRSLALGYVAERPQFEREIWALPAALQAVATEVWLMRHYRMLKGVKLPYNRHPDEGFSRLERLSTLLDAV